jgi:hypothetical protein
MSWNVAYGTVIVGVVDASTTRGKSYYFTALWL